MITLVGLKPLPRPLKRAQMTFETAAEGVDHQRAEILGTTRCPRGGELAATKLTGHLHQPGHIQSGGLNSAAQISADPALSRELNLTLLRLQPATGLEAPP